LLPEGAARVRGFWSVFRQEHVEQHDIRRDLPDLTGLRIERAFGRCDQQAQHQCGDRSDQAGAESDRFFGVRIELVTRNQTAERDAHDDAGKRQE
jgi:hypothetical protein